MKNRGVLLVIILLFICFSISAVSVKEASPTAKDLQAKWNWAVKESKGKECYIAYSIQRMMGENSYMGCYHSDDSKDDISLYELVTGKKLDPAMSAFKKKSVSDTAKDALKHAKGIHKKQKKVLKDLAVIFKLDKKRSKGFDCKDIRVSNMESPAHLEDLPLYWLGKANNEESVELLKKHFANTSSDKARERLVMAIGIHQKTKTVFPFLKKVLTGSYSEEVRKDTAFWIAEQETPDTVKLLVKTALNDASVKVKKSCVFGLYRIDLNEADDALIKLAKAGKDYDVRKQAIFWLGQKAVKESAEVLKDVVYNDPDVSLKNKAVFALSQLSDGKGIPLLIKIARTHKNMKVRKKAIFWLGQSGDERALDAIIKIIKGK
jgi:HEAT repeat protein